MRQFFHVQIFFSIMSYMISKSFLCSNFPTTFKLKNHFSPIIYISCVFRRFSRIIFTSSIILKDYVFILLHFIFFRVSICIPLVRRHIKLPYRWWVIDTFQVSCQIFFMVYISFLIFKKLQLHSEGWITVSQPYKSGPLLDN